jgi:hypothetical protein
MRTKHLLLLAAIGLATEMLLLGLWLSCSSPGITVANFGRLRIGMSVKEIEVVLGGPATSMSFVTNGIVRGWESDDCAISIIFVCGNSGRTDNPKENNMATEGGLWIGNDLRERLGNRDSGLIEKLRLWLR